MCESEKSARSICVLMHMRVSVPITHHVCPNGRTMVLNSLSALGNSLKLSRLSHLMNSCMQDVIIDEQDKSIAGSSLELPEFTRRSNNLF